MARLLWRLSRRRTAGVSDGVVGFSVFICFSVLFSIAQAEAAFDDPSNTGPATDALRQLNVSVTADKNTPWEQRELVTLAKLLQSLPKELLPAQVIPAPQLPLKLHKSNAAGDAPANLHPSSTELAIPAHEKDSYETASRRLLHFLLHQYDTTSHVSDDAHWRVISGWEKNLLFYTANNQDDRAYATPLGKQNPEEDFVTTAEQFFLPPVSTAEDSIKCRIPRKYNFIKAYFAAYHSPLDKDYVVCRQVDHGMLDDIEFFSPTNGERVNIGPINLHTVTGFELLYATPGTGDASEIAGHLLLRIKLDNNPEATKLGIENPHDLVISFLANTQENKRPHQEAVNKKPPPSCKKDWFNLVDSEPQGFDALQSIYQSLKGLSGGFLTIMDRQTLEQTVKHYTIDEDRNLLRYRLLLSGQQKRDLLQHLYLAKKNYNAKYFFFNQNCASVLVKVVGQGIGVAEIADFNPMVSPPNALVALFIRHGLAKPVYPSFYSYRKKGYLAQEHIKQRYQALKTREPGLQWPDINGLFANKESERLTTTKSLESFYPKAARHFQEFYHLASLIQEAEMVYDHKELHCADYTSTVTAEARSFQQHLLKENGEQIAQRPLNLNNELAESYINTESHSFSSGVPYTKLLSYKVGFGHYATENQQTPILQLEATAMAQDMGSATNVAMQRGGFVRLGDFSLSLALDGKDTGKIQHWRATLLKIRKFKERLNYVPSYFSRQGNIGLGLTLVDFTAETPYKLKHGTLLGGELLFNLFSTPDYNNFAFVSIGAELHSHSEADERHRGLMLPAHGEVLLGFGQQQRWQWRAQMDYRYSLSDTLDNEIDANTDLSYRLGRLHGALLFAKVGGRYYETLRQHGRSNAAWLNWVGIEVNRW